MGSTVTLAPPFPPYSSSSSCCCSRRLLQRHRIHTDIVRIQLILKPADKTDDTGGVFGGKSDTVELCFAVSCVDPRDVFSNSAPASRVKVLLYLTDYCEMEYSQAGLLNASLAGCMTRPETNLYSINVFDKHVYTFSSCCCFRILWHDGNNWRGKKPQ